jgi:CDP-6-deoxy-D-xylo-4-hexulose-3-dehydrase
MPAYKFWRNTGGPGSYKPGPFSLSGVGSVHDIVKPPFATGWFFPTAFSSWGPEENEAIARVIASNKFTMGTEVEAFEAEFAGYHRMKYGIMVNSGSSANLIMVAALFNKKDSPLRRGQLAVVPAIAWSTTYAPLVQAGLDLKLVDCDDTWCMELPDVTRASLVVGCSILGSPANLNFLKVAADSHSAYFIEDNCESLGAWYANDRCGTFGLMNSFSFFYSHQISAIEGGMILTNDAECAKLCRILRAHGWSRDIETPLSFDTEYNFTHFGYNVRPLEMHAAIAREQLKKLVHFVGVRQANLRSFRNQTRGLPIVPQVMRGLDPSPFGLSFCLRSKEVRAKVVTELRKNGIDCRLPTGGSFRRHPYGAWYAHSSTPNADRVHDTGLFLGNAPYKIDPQIEKAVKVMKDVLE